MNNLLTKIKNNKKKIALLTSGLAATTFLLLRTNPKTPKKSKAKQETQLVIELKKEFESYDKNLMNLLIKNKEKLGELENNIATKNETIQDLKLTIQNLKLTIQGSKSSSKGARVLPPRIITKNLYQNTNELDKTKKELKKLKLRYDAISLQVDYQFQIQEELKIAKQNLKDIQIQTIGYNKERESLVKDTQHYIKVTDKLSIENAFLKQNLDEAKQEIAFLRKEWDIQFGKLIKENEMLKKNL
jgi:hypothetical protein